MAEIVENDNNSLNNMKSFKPNEDNLQIQFCEFIMVVFQEDDENPFSGYGFYQSKKYLWTEKTRKRSSIELWHIILLGGRWIGQSGLWIVLIHSDFNFLLRCDKKNSLFFIRKVPLEVIQQSEESNVWIRIMCL